MLQSTKIVCIWKCSTFHYITRFVLTTRDAISNVNSFCALQYPIVDWSTVLDLGVVRSKVCCSPHYSVNYFRAKTILKSKFSIINQLVLPRPRIGSFVNLLLLIGMKNFHFTIFWYPRVYPFQKNIVSYPGTLGWNFCQFGDPVFEMLPLALWKVA